MKVSHLLTLALFMCFLGTYSQTGIGTQLPNISSELEVFSKEKGILIPRIELKSKTDKTTVAGTAYPESLLIYHTGTKGLLAGFYFWSTDKWNALVSNTTLNHYIKEEALADSVTITHDNGDYIFTWKDKNTGAEMTMKLSDVIKKFETLTELNSGYEENEATLIYTPERGTANKVKMTELLKGSSVFNEYIKSLIPAAAKETVTTIVRYNKVGGVENITTKPIDGMIHYEYDNELKEKKYITVSQDVSNDFETILNQNNNTELIENIAKSVKGSDNYYSTIKEEIIGKWNDKDVMRYVVKLNQATAFTSVELPKVIAGLVVDAKLINEATNSMTRGVISKQVDGSKTKLAIGTSGTIIPNNPSGNYYVIVEYVKE
jgi:hypothetical protein